MKADRYNQGKLKWGLVHWPSIEPLVSVLMFGAEKYAPDNWKKGLDRKEILESAMRHMVALFNGEEYDKESKLSHAGHVMCNMMFYIFFTKKSSDDKCTKE
ncbi:MAG: dATP/dGTP diphosphohydrolase domain-containing protein [Chitinophagaceae bacterium]